MSRKTLSTLALASALVLPLSTIGCSQGQSPTEPALSDLESSADSSMSSVTGESRGRGGNDQANDDNNNNRQRGRGGRGRGGDDNNQPQNPQNPQPPRAGQEFEGTVAQTNAGSLTLAGGTRIVINAQTQWDARSDLRSLSAVAGSIRAGQSPRVEGRGTRQADGSIVAQTIKAEVDQR